MQSFTRQLQNATAHVRLTNEERADLRSQVQAYVAYQPIRTHHYREQLRMVHILRGLRQALGYRYATGALLIASMVSMGMYGVTSAATTSLPGDLLYPVKVNVNEEIRGALTVGTESRAAWEQERAERRLEEAGQLALQGRLDTERQNEVTQLLEKHTNAVVETVRELERTDPVLAAEVSTDLEQSLDTHEAVLARIVVEATDEGSGVAAPARTLVEHVHSMASEAGDVRKSVEQQLAVADPAFATATDELLPTSTSSATGGGKTSEVDTPEALREGLERARERAATLQQTATLRLEALDPASELAGQARDQLARGTAYLDTGSTAADRGDTRAAYSAFRAAGDEFQSLVQVLQASNIFAITILPDSVRVPTDMDTDYATDTTPTEDVGALHTEVADSIRTTQQLASVGTSSDPQAIQVRDLIKDATAHLLRGEVALTLDDYTEAQERLEAARAYVTQARLQLVDTTSKAETVEGGEVASGTEQGSGTGTPLTIEATYEHGVQTYRGTLATECATTTANLVPAATSTPAFVLSITTDTGTSTDACVSGVPFEVATETPAHAELVEVLLNGATTPFTVSSTHATTTGAE